MQEPAPKQTRKFYAVLKEQLRQAAGGEHVVQAFEQGGAAGDEHMAEFLRQHLADNPQLVDRLAAALAPDDRPQFITAVAGGEVDQIVNIARLGVLNLTVRNQFFIFKDVKQMLIASALLTAMCVAAGYAYWQSIQPPPQPQPQVMTGNFNIAVADFGEQVSGTVRSSPLASQLSGALFNFLESQFSNSHFGLKVQVDHKNMNPILEQEEAEKLAERVNADIVIYGTVIKNGDGGSLQPSFWVRARPDTEELTGQLGQPIYFRGIEDGLAEAEVRKTLRPQATALLSFVEGLVRLDNGEGEFAQHNFEDSLQAMKSLGYCHSGASEETQGGCEVVHLFLGVAHSNQGHYDKAEEEFNEALALHPGYARAYNGLGNVFYARAVNNDYEVKWLDLARVNYEKALNASVATAPSLSLLKANYNLGNAYVVRAQTTYSTTLFTQAIERYQVVITAHDKYQQEPGLDALAANAYCGLGVAYQGQCLIDKAKTAYETCHALAKAEGNAGLQKDAQTQLDAINSRGSLAMPPRCPGAVGMVVTGAGE